MTSPNEKIDSNRYGLIAGWGNYPLLLARALKNDGHHVYCIGVAGHAASHELSRICDVYREMGLARFGAATRFFRKYRVTEATMAGKIFKKYLLRPGLVWRHLPDFYTFLTFFSLFLAGKSDLKDDTLLLTAVKAFENKGINLIPATDLAPDLLMAKGQWSEKRLSEVDCADIRLAWPLVREIGRLDFGQAVIVRNGKILAIEGIDGTDGAIARAGKEAKGKPFTVVKVAKPNQDMRFDVPAVGINTLEKMATLGADILVIEADRTLCVDPRQEFLARANQLGIAVVSISESELAIKSSLPLSDNKFALSCFTKNRPTKRELKDLQLGIPVMRSLIRFNTGQAVTVRERSVLAVRSTVESRAQVIHRTAEVAPDRFSLILGHFSGDETAIEIETLLREIEMSNIRVIAVDTTPTDEFLSLLIKIAERDRIALVQIKELNC